MNTSFWSQPLLKLALHLALAGLVGFAFLSFGQASRGWLDEESARLLPVTFLIPAFIASLILVRSADRARTAEKVPGAAAIVTVGALLFLGGVGLHALEAEIPGGPAVSALTTLLRLAGGSLLFASAIHWIQARRTQEEA